MGGKLSEHFNIKEFACNCRNNDAVGYGFCGGTATVDMGLVNVLEQLITDLTTDTMNRVVVKITSGYRCAPYNKRVGGAPNSQHMKGIAADIQVKHLDGTPVEPSAVADYLEEKYPDTFGIGRYKRWTHIDIRDDKARWRG
jgi:uncharacterized protein YcbK (DUF882 family)